MNQSSEVNCHTVKLKPVNLKSSSSLLFDTSTSTVINRRRMTKLQEWLSGLGVLLAIWFYMVNGRENYDFVFYSPVIFVILFGLYAASVVLYRVYTFNDCKEAAIQLQNEILEAKDNLTELGFKFKEKSN